MTDHGSGLLSAKDEMAASLDASLGDGNTTLAELIADDTAAVAEQHDTRRRLWSALRLLPDRHRQVLVRRYGLVGPAQTHREIGAWLGVGDHVPHAA